VCDSHTGHANGCGGRERVASPRPDPSIGPAAPAGAPFPRLCTRPPALWDWCPTTARGPAITTHFHAPQATCPGGAPVWGTGGQILGSNSALNPCVVTIASNEFSIGAVMALLGGADTNFVLSGMWNKTPWRVWLHEPTDTLIPACWTLELGDHRYPLRQQSAEWDMNPHTKTWEQSKSGWRVRTADGRWIPSLQDLGADLIIDS
jgi:hypothetical protein